MRRLEEVNGERDVLGAAQGLATSYWQLLLTRVLVGIGEATGGPVAHAMICDLFPPDERGRALSVWNTAIPAGTLLGLLLGGGITGSLGWRAAFIIVGLPGVVLAALGMVAGTARRHRLASFCGAWFFLQLAIESTVVPLALAMEHRLYLPLLGPVIALVDFGARRWPSRSPQRMAWAVAVGVVVVLLSRHPQHNVKTNASNGAYCLVTAWSGRRT